MSIVPARVQDWLIGALNPMIDGLRAEQAVKNRLYWVPGGRFEYFNPLGDYVFDQDNLEDLEAHHPDVTRSRLAHDDALDNLRSALAKATVAVEANPELIGDISRVANLRPQNPPPNTDRNYLVAYVCEGALDLGDRYSLAPLWREHGPRLSDSFARVLPEHRERIDRDARTFRTQVESGLILFKALRIELADRYGVRLKPVA